MQSSDSPFLNKQRCWQCFPLLQKFILAPASCGTPVGVRRLCRHPLSGNPAVGLAPCMRCDVRVADLQVGRTLWELLG